MLPRIQPTKQQKQTELYRETLWNKGDGRTATIVIKTKQNDVERLEPHRNTLLMADDDDKVFALINNEKQFFDAARIYRIYLEDGDDLTGEADAAARDAAMDLGLTRAGETRVAFSLVNNDTSVLRVFKTNVSAAAGVLSLFYWTRAGYFWHTGAQVGVNSAEAQAKSWLAAFNFHMDEEFLRDGPRAPSASSSSAPNGAAKSKRARRNTSAQVAKTDAPQAWLLKQRLFLRTNIRKTLEAAKHELVEILSNECVDENDALYARPQFAHYNSKDSWYKAFYLPMQAASMKVALATDDLGKATTIMNEFDTLWGSGHVVDVNKLLSIMQRTWRG